MNTKLFLVIIVLLIALSSLNAEKYAGEIFKMGAGVRNYALGRTGITDEKSPALAYWNSSMLLYQKERVFDLMHAEEFSGLLKYDTISGSFGEDYSIGFTLARIGINNINLTKLTHPDLPIGPDNPPVLDKTVNNSDYILYFGLARMFGKVPIGVTPKLVYRRIAEESAFSFGADVTTNYVANEFFTFGLRLRDIIPTQIYYENGTHESVNFGADIEMRVNTQMPILEKPLVLFVNSEINNEGMKKYSSLYIEEVSFEPHLGAELILHPMVSFLIGYNIDSFTAGMGIHYRIFLLNYAFEQNSELDNSHRFSLGVNF